jgi:hypothetical protein
VANSPLQFLTNNVNRLKKVALSQQATQSIIVRWDSWLRVNRPLFETLSSQTHSEYTVTVTAANGVSTSSAEMGYSTSGTSGGGDFGLIEGTLDHHDSSYYNLQNGCQHHYL